MLWKVTRSNAFVALCKHEENVKTMTFGNCDLFKRSFTTQGMGFTFNNEVEEILIKKDFRSAEFSHNVKRHPSLMKSTKLKHSLKVVIDRNMEEALEEWMELLNNGIVPKQKQVSVSLHNPKEPADTKFIPSTSVKIPFGHSTTFLITPYAWEIDEKAEKDLQESQRNCRLIENNEKLDVFNSYTKVSCLFECSIKYAIRRCGCVPWNYPLDVMTKV